MTLTAPAAAAALLATLLASAGASAATITFDDLASGAVLSNQYAALGVVFTPNAFTGQGITTNWATNTGMHVTSTDLPEPLPAGGLLSGNVLNGYARDWYRNNGDPSVKMTFSAPVSAVSITVGRASKASDIHLWAYNGATLLGDVVGNSTGGFCTGIPGFQECDFVMGFSSASITSVVFNPGTFQQWVAIDNISFTQAVPEPTTTALMGLGVAVVVAAGRRRQHRRVNAGA